LVARVGFEPTTFAAAQQAGAFDWQVRCASATGWASNKATPVFFALPSTEYAR
jgi:hypothetical protein